MGRVGLVVVAGADNRWDSLRSSRPTLISSAIDADAVSLNLPVALDIAKYGAACGTERVAATAADVDDPLLEHVALLLDEEHLIG